MASITSVISFFILLLATYSYSAPITPEYDNVTPQYEFTTGTILVEHQTPVNMLLVNGEESTTYSGVTRPSREFPLPYGQESTTFSGVTRPLRNYRESSEESTTFGGVTRSPRTFESISFPTSTIQADSQEKREFDVDSLPTVQPDSQEKREFDVDSLPTVQPESQEKREFDVDSLSTVQPDSQEKREFDVDSSSTVQPEKRGFYQYSTSALETATNFNERAIGQADYPETFEASTPFYSEKQPEMQKNFQQSSSVDSFGQSTGLLQNGQSNGFQNGQSNGFQNGQSNDASGGSFRDPNTELKQTISLPSGQIFETKVYSSKQSSTSEEPSKSEQSIKNYGLRPTEQS